MPCTARGGSGLVFSGLSATRVGGMIMDVIEAIKNRRSIRHYQAAPVDEKSVRAVLEAAHWAPSWGNIQCWRFIVVRDRNVKAKVADTLMKTMVDDAWVENAAASAIKEAPVPIVVCAELGK